MAVDPDLVAAIADLGPVAAELRAAKVRQREMEEAGGATLRDRAALREQIAELSSRISVRAGRIGVDATALRLLLRVEHQQRQRQRRKPGLHVLRRAVKAEQGLATDRERAAHEALSRAQDDVRRATAHRHAAQAACSALEAA